MAKIVKSVSEKWAYDISKDVIDVGEVWDVNVINQSIEMILTTIPGERLFNPYFGFGLQTRIFDIHSSEDADNLLDEIAEVINVWEDRIIVLENKMKIISNVDKHFIAIIIPYVIRNNGIKSTFSKKIKNI